ncbi:MAG: ROK family protein [Flavisolibacter sp.]
MEQAEIDKILSIDIGGSHLKATLLDHGGTMQTDYVKFVTPLPANPDNVIKIIQKLAQSLPGYEKVSVGFPGYVKDGVVITAPNLDNEHWKNMPLSERLTTILGKPTRVVNDADLQGMGVVSGKGYEVVITLGTGFGTAFLKDGNLLPHIELAHHPVTKSKTYDQYIGEKALVSCGEKKWNKRMAKVLLILKTVFNYDRLYISGGNASKLKFPLEGDITIISNRDGIKGGAKLWKQS